MYSSRELNLWCPARVIFLVFYLLIHVFDYSNKLFHSHYPIFHIKRMKYKKIFFWGGGRLGPTHLNFKQKYQIFSFLSDEIFFCMYVPQGNIYTYIYIYIYITVVYTLSSSSISIKVSVKSSFKSRILNKKKRVIYGG